MDAPFSAEEPPGRGTDEDGPLSAPLGPLGAWTTDILSNKSYKSVEVRYITLLYTNYSALYCTRYSWEEDHTVVLLCTVFCISDFFDPKLRYFHVYEYGYKIICLTH